MTSPVTSRIVVAVILLAVVIGAVPSGAAAESHVAVGEPLAAVADTTGPAHRGDSLLGRAQLPSTDSLITGPVRRSLLIDGEYDAMRVPDTADLTPRSALTIELWVKRQGGAACGTLVGKNRDESYWLAICDGRLRFTPGGSRGLVDGSAIIPEGRWTHVAVVYNGSERNYYVDGNLDKRTTENARPLGRSDSDLFIGADSEMGAAFDGKIDLVRLWSLTRSRDQIADNAFAVLPRQPGLVAQWTLDGSSDDLVGGHDGRSSSGLAFSLDGPQPRDLRVPLTQSPVNVDGHCNADEYSMAERVAIDNKIATRITVLATDFDVYLCVADMPRPNGNNAFAGFLLDRNGGFDDRAQPGDYRITINYRGTTETEEGDGNGGWRDVDLVDDAWDAVRVTESGPIGTGQDRWSAEFRFRRSLIDRPSDPDEPVSFGLAVTQSSTNTTTGDAFWPVRTVETSPATWALATLADKVGLPPVSTFSGSVTQALPDDESRGLGGALIQLLVVDEDNLTLVDEDMTDGGGDFELRFEGRPMDAFLVREVDPRGVLSLSADGGADGEPSGPNVLLYEVDDNRLDQSMAYSPAAFVDAFGPADAGMVGQHFLVVYAAPVEEADLEPLLLARRRQGFTVVAVSTADLERISMGGDLGAKIHNWLHAYWTVVEPEPVYALLVGRGDKIPVRDIGWMDNDHREHGEPDYYPAWPTDWYYADLDSEWDANDNGFFGEFLRCPPGETYPDDEADDGESECPEDGSLRREGPFGELRGSADDFQPEISIGRLAVNQRAEVRSAVAATLAFESSTAEDKARALLAGAFWSFEGRTWVEREDEDGDVTGSYVPGGNVTSHPWIRAAWDGDKPLGDDSAEYMDTALRAVLAEPMDQVYRLYESASPGGDPALSPTRRNPDAPISAQNVGQAWQSGHYGLANFAGTGARYGVTAAHWLADWTENRRIEQPDQPLACEGLPVPPGDRFGPPCYELFSEVVAGTLLPPTDGLPPVAVANAAGTGGVAWTFDGMDQAGNVIGLSYGPDAMAGSLPSRQLATAWIGAFADVEPGALNQFQTRFARELLSTPLRMGDAAWLAASELARSDPYVMRSYGVQLFGDPSMPYWGSPADSDGAWPQDGRDWQVSGATSWSGPNVLAQAWETTGSEQPGSAPVIGSDGNLVVVGSNAVARYAPSGDRLDSGALSGVGGGALRYPAALADDGVYVAAGVSLLKFDYDLDAGGTFSLPGPVSGAPRIAPDGAVWVPTSAGMTRVTGNGEVTVIDARQAVASASVMPTGEVVWPTADGSVRYWTVDPTGEVEQGSLAGPGLGDLTGLAINDAGTVYAGTSDGRLWAIPEEGDVWQTGTGGPVRSRPVIGADSAVYVGNTRGDIIAFEPDSRRERWRTDLDETLVAPPVVDGSRLFVAAGDSLFALELATGNIEAQLNLGGLDTRSAPVIGSDRTLYLVRSDTTIVAVRENGWLATPSDVAVTVGPTSTVITWRDNSAGEIGFSVELCDLDDDCFDAGTTMDNEEQVVVFDLPVPVGDPFYARVVALGLAGASEVAGSGATVNGLAQASDTNHASDYGRSPLAIGLPEAPDSPTVLEAEAVGADAIDVMWQYDGDVGELVGFTVSRRKSGESSFTDLAALGADVMRYEDRGLDPDTEYRYRVVAETASGVSPTAAVDATTWELVNQGPRSLTAQVDRASVTLRWNDDAFEETGYLVERLSPGWSEYQVIGRLAPNAISFLDQVYLEEGFYHYRVTALWEDEEQASAAVEMGAVVTGADLLEIWVPFALQNRR